jgi:hypothetical protein
MVGRGDLVRIIALHLVTRCKKLFVILRNAEHYRFGVGVLRLRGDRTRFLGPAPPIFRVLCLASWAMLGKREIALALRRLQKRGVSLQLE